MRRVKEAVEDVSVTKLARQVLAGGDNRLADNQ